MIRLLVRGYPQGPELPARPTAHVLDPGAPITPAQIDVLALGFARGVVVVQPPGDQASHRELDRLHCLLDSERVVVHHSTLSPVAGAVLGSLGAALSATAPTPAALAGALAVLERTLWVGAWLPSVRRLRDPRARTSQRLRSLLPGGSFVVRRDPAPAVWSMGEGDALEAPQLPGPGAVAVAGTGRGGGWAAETLARAAGGGPVCDVGASGDAARWWGSGRALELVAYPTDIDRLSGELFSRPEHCLWCDEPLVGESCRLCADARRTARAAGEGPRMAA